MAVEVAQKTYADLAGLPEDSLAQLIDGEIIMSPAPIPKHQKVLLEIAYQIKIYINENHTGEVFLSPIDVYFSNTEVYQPDLIFIAQNRLNIIGEKYIEHAPDLIVEVLSESNAYFDLKHKKNIYEKSGVKEYWIVDPIALTIEIFILQTKENINQYTLSNGLQSTGVAKSILLDGFIIDIPKLFL